MSARYGGRQPPVAPRARLTVAPEELGARSPLLQAFDQMRPGEMAPRGPWLGTIYHSRVPLLTKPPGPGEFDFTGLRIDRLTVIGRVDETGNAGGGRWLVRCDCGIYETRRHRGLAGRMRTDRACCAECDYLAVLRKRAFFDRHGYWPSDEPAYGLETVAATLPKAGIDKGNRGKGNRTEQRRRLKARKRAERMERLKAMPAGRVRSMADA